MQLDSLPDLYQPPSHDARETNRGNLSKGIKTLKFWIFFFQLNIFKLKIKYFKIEI